MRRSPANHPPLDTLVDEALGARPEVAALRDQLRAQELTNKSTYGRYWPSLQALGGRHLRRRRARPAGLEPQRRAQPVVGDLRRRRRAGRAARGGRRRGRDRARRSTACACRCASTSNRRSLAVAAAKAALGAADRSLSNAQARLDLAEVRYRTGVGNGIELSDAQLASTNAAFQKLQAQLKLDTARAQLTKALAR